MCQEEHICTRANRHHTSLMMPVRPSSFLLISFLIWLLLIVRLSYFWLWFTYQDKLCALTRFYMLKVFPHTIDIEEILYIVSIKCTGNTAHFYKTKMIFYLTEIIFLSLYVNHSSVTFLGVNFFLLKIPARGFYACIVLKAKIYVPSSFQVSMSNHYTLWTGRLLIIHQNTLVKKIAEA